MSNNPIKKCRVCGAEALCFNFNGLSCEACKVFFRRNAFKLLRCKYFKNCKVNKSTRKSCKKCRMDKCLEIGMKKEIVYVTHMERLAVKNNIPNFISDFNNFLPYDALRLNEVQRAMSVFPSEHRITRVEHTNDMFYFINISEYYIPKVVKYCKQIEAFKVLKAQDQYVLLRSFFCLFASTYAAFNFNIEGDCLTGVMDESEQKVVVFKMDSATHTKKRVNGNAMRKFMIQMKNAMEDDCIIRNLVITQLLFRPQHDTACPEFIKYLYHSQQYLLWKYLKLKYKYRTEQKFTALQEAICGIENCVNALMNIFTEEVDPSQMNEMLTEMVYGYIQSA